MQIFCWLCDIVSLQLTVFYSGLQNLVLGIPNNKGVWFDKSAIKIETYGSCSFIFLRY